MKKILPFSILLFLSFPLLFAGEGKGEVSSGGKAPAVSMEKKPKALPEVKVPPAEKKSLEGSFCENLPHIIRSFSGNAPIAKLWKEELEKDPHAFLKRFLETEKSGIRVLKSPPIPQRYQRPAGHLLSCRECGKRFSAPPLLHGHRIRNDILLIRIHKWDHASYANIGKLLKMNEKKFSFLLWDLRECRGDSPVSVKNTLSHLKKYKVPSALLVSGRTSGSAELFAKALQKADKNLLSAGEKTPGLPFLMEMKKGSFLLAPSGKKVDYLLLLPKIPPFFRTYDCAPFRPDLIYKDVFSPGKKDILLHHLCDLMLAKSILAKGGK